ncbi:protease HtpX [Aestuariibacter halophilus]|uniref:Protease HtpX n=1 Tax=Fluctibacter halophilus TaxID=226011 RepID=A0ABS8G839_9ALTE|nr:protease HtpX [Aestuariibacter halophilus]MCC2615391.1 protease HtpX [Aestuariibacter halophilus]
MLRIGLFLATNLAILVLLGVMFRLLGFEGLLAQNGVDLNLQALLVYAAVIGFAGAFISLALSKFLAKKTMGVQIISQPTDRTQQWLLSTVARQAEQLGVGMPEVGIFHHPSSNAFATGWNRNDALVAVSTGLLSSMNEDEVEAVLAHEMSHVANGDMVTMALIQGVVNTFVVFLSRIVGHVVDRAVFKVERGHGPAFWIVSMISEIILGILAMTIVMWFSRQREYRADAGAAALVGRHKMIAALQRLRQASGQAELPDEMAALAINAGKLHAIFASHPPLEDRIRALQ